MIDKIKRVIITFPLIPIFIIGVIFEAIRCISTSIVSGCLRIKETYRLMIYEKFPDLVITAEQIREKRIKRMEAGD